ncbi:MAG: hypothetical protein RLZZ385_1312 [Pseudomonadota bacterium]|jgi:membrane fusion protein (multidrug efflux system)
MTNADSPASPPSRPSLARRLRHLLVLLIVPLGIAGLGGWLWLHGGRYVSTDNAYIKTEILSISSNVSGMVVELAARDGQAVKRGDLLLRVDDQPYVIAVARAEASLAAVRSEIESLKAELANKLLEVETAQRNLDYRDKELERNRSLFEQKSISGVLFDQALFARDTAERDLAEKRQAVQVVKARLLDPALPTDQHPRIKLALAELDKVKLDLSHTEVHAPADGVVVNISTHVGENVMSGAPLLSLIDEHKVWLEANFKETDLTYMREGQPTTVTVDAYPGLELQARVATITPATGAEFSLLPAQNSSGNWVKVVQRIKVQIAVEVSADMPVLASGMSAEVRIDTGHRRSLPWLTASR